MLPESKSGGLLDVSETSDISKYVLWTYKLAKNIVVVGSEFPLHITTTPKLELSTNIPKGWPAT
ncbi:MAG: hypothetical protein WBP83_08695, partial [Nitrososphaeraceae archaeon]